MAESCGAKTRSGGPCKTAPMQNGRCRMHGGATPKTNQNAVTHGIYRKLLTPEEQLDYDGLELGKVDDELRLMRIRLARALAAEHAAAGMAELEEITVNIGGGPNVADESRKSRVRDYCKLIDATTARIESLERTRMLLVDGEGGGNEDVVGFEVREYVENSPVAR
ncbi:MAG: hypothetical protein JWQ72_2979 [Polaromonas sp.]|nr:hypothetical protein [Polaromonas sp.]